MDRQQDAYSNDDGISSELPILDPLFLSTIEETVKNQHVINTTKRCFIEHKITSHYFQYHKRKDLAVLLRKYNVKISISIKLWAAFNNNNDEEYDNWNAQKLRKNNDCVDSQYDDSVEFIDINAESKGIKEDGQSIRYILYILVRGYSRRYIHDEYEDVIKLFIFYYASIDIVSLIKSSLKMIDWSNIEIISSQSTNNGPLKESVAVSEKAMNEFCFIALETDNLIQIGDKEWILIVHVIDDDGNCDIGVSFKYNYKSEYLFVAIAIYLDKTAIELKVLKHEFLRLKHNYWSNILPFSLKEINIIHHDEIMEIKQDDDDDDMISGMQCQSDW